MKEKTKASIGIILLVSVTCIIAFGVYTWVGRAFDDSRLARLENMAERFNSYNWGIPDNVTLESFWSFGMHRRGDWWYSTNCFYEDVSPWNRTCWTFWLNPGTNESYVKT